LRWKVPAIRLQIHIRFVMQPFAGLHPSTTRPILTPKLEQRSFCSAQNPASFGVKLAYGVVFTGNSPKEKA
jgi:hypothetical protein